MSMKIEEIRSILILVLLLKSTHYSTQFHKISLSPYYFSAGQHYTHGAQRLTKPLIREDGRVYACSERSLFAFESNGTVAWSVALNHTCSANIAPVNGGPGKIFLVAGNRVLKVNPLNITRSAIEVFFDPEGPGEILGLAISNNEGELYSLSMRTLHFRWIQDFSSFDKAFTITPGNNGRLYVTVPVQALILALDASRGNILWQGNIGPLSSADYEPVVDSNGWISIGSLDGFLYSFSPTGELTKFPKWPQQDAVIQVNPILDCSGYAVYVFRTKMEGKSSLRIGEYTHFSAMKPKSVVFEMIIPASGTIYWSENYPGQFLYNLSSSDLQHFVLDEGILLAFIAASRNGNPYSCRTTLQKLSSSCAQIKPKNISIYAGDEKTIVLFLLLETTILVLLAVAVRFCCIFWKKRKLQNQDLGEFLEERRLLQHKKKALNRTITELKQKTRDEAVANKVLETLSNMVKEKESIERKLSTSYSFGRDVAGSSGLKTPLPLQDRSSRSCPLCDTSDDDSSSSKDMYESKQPAAEDKAKAPIQVQSSTDDDTEDAIEDWGTPSSLAMEKKGEKSNIQSGSMSIIRKRVSSLSKL